MFGVFNKDEYVDIDRLKRKVIQALRTIRDPELPTNIYDLGLIYAIHITLEGEVSIVMTLTTPACPVAQNFPEQVSATVSAVNGVSDCDIKLVWEPKWTPERMSQLAKVQLDMF